MAITGNGTQANPWILTEPNDFNFIRNRNPKTGYMELGNDIDFADETREFTSLGNNSNKFNMIFDGKGYTIKNLKVASASASNLGAHGFLGTTNADAVLKNIKFENMYVENNYGNTASMFTVNYGKFENIHVQGVLNVSASTVGRVGVIASFAYGHLGFTFNNIYTEVEIRMNNAVPQNPTTNFIGGIGGSVTSNAESIPKSGNVVLNNTIIAPNINEWAVGSIGGFVTDVNAQYTNSYVNISNYPITAPSDSATRVTDETILNPLTLDRNYWIQKPNSIPELKTFASSDGGTIDYRDATIAYNVSSVDVEASKQIYGTTIPILFKAPRIDSQSVLEGYRNSDISTLPYLVEIEVTNAKIDSAEVDIPFSLIKVSSTTTKTATLGSHVPFEPIGIKISVEYPQNKDKPVYAITYAVKNLTNVYGKKSFTSTYII